MTNFLLGVIVGLLIALINLLAYKPEVQRVFQKIISKKAQIVEMDNEIEI